MKNNYFIKKEIIKNLSNIKNKPVKLIGLCNGINVNYSKKVYTGVIIFTRVILDYIPPIYGFSKTCHIYNNLKGQKTFKKALEIIDKSSRLIADDLLHSQASLNELINVDLKSCDLIRDNLSIILSSVLGQLQNNDLRDTRVREEVKQEPKSQFELFKKYIKDQDNWVKEFINNNEVWVYSKDNLYQICKADGREDFSEPWTQVWPDSRGSGKYFVDLRYNGTTIKQLILIYFDGGREDIILPKVETNNSKNQWGGKDIYGGSYKNVNYYIEKNSIEYDLSNLIGSDVERVAKRSHIEIR